MVSLKVCYAKFFSAQVRGSLAVFQPNRSILAGIYMWERSHDKTEAKEGQTCGFNNDPSLEKLTMSHKDCINQSLLKLIPPVTQLPSTWFHIWKVPSPLNTVTASSKRTLEQHSNHIQTLWDIITITSQMDKREREKEARAQKTKQWRMVLGTKKLEINFISFF